MYKTSTKPLEERKELIEQACKSAKEMHPFYEFQNKRHDLPIIRLETTTPIYRMQNYRTRTAQLKYIHDHKKAADFFGSGQENESAQQAQHDILTIFAKQGRSGSITAIFEALQTEEQRDPLIVTAGGVVVNGNRRLAAMRELFTEKPSQFPHFSHVDCAVLPASITPDEIREIEVRLQMRPETKLPYEWVNESLAIQELLQSGKTVVHIADLMKKKKPEVERADRALREAEIYLREWMHAPGEYQLVEDAEQFFNDLAKGIEGKQGEALEASRRIAWALLSAENLEGRLYNYNFSFGKRTDEVISSLADRLGIDLTAQGDDGVEDEDDDDLDIDIEEDADATSLDNLLEAFDDPSQRAEITDELISVCENIIELDRAGKVGKRALAAVQSANAKLQEVDMSKAEPATYPAIDTQLDSVIERATKLKENLKPYKSGTSS